MRKLSEIKKEYDTLAIGYIDSVKLGLTGTVIDNTEKAMIKLDKEMLKQKEKYPYGGVCEDCGKETSEFCHDSLCLDCCIKRNRLYEEIYDE